MSRNIEKQNKRSVLDYGMEWFDYHMTVGLYLSVAIAALLFIFVFLGQFYRTEVRSLFPEVELLDRIMWIYYAVYAVVIMLMRKLFLAEDRRSFGLSLVMFLVRAVFHAFVVFYLWVVAKGIIGLDHSIFYTYMFYFSVITAVINVVNIIYFIVRRKIFDYAE